MCRKSMSSTVCGVCSLGVCSTPRRDGAVRVPHGGDDRFSGPTDLRSGHPTWQARAEGRWRHGVLIGCFESTVQLRVRTKERFLHI